MERVAREASVAWSSPRLLVLVKPAGVSLQTPRGRLGAAVTELLAALPLPELRRVAPDPSSLLLVHRLDEGTSGLVVLARDPDAHRALSDAFQGRRVSKTYLAVVRGCITADSGLFDAPLGPDRQDRRRMRPDPAGSPARTRWRVLGRAGTATLLELEPETGRTHQIRVHLAAAGHVIVGDDLYGDAPGTPPGARHPLLHAFRLALPELPAAAGLPAEPARVLTAPPPPDFSAALASFSLPAAPAS